ASGLLELRAAADVDAAEDTRRLARLARDLDVTVTGRIVSYFDGNEERRTPELLEALRAGGGGGGRGGDRRRHAQRLGPRLPAGACRAGRRLPGERRAGAQRRDHRRRGVRTAQRPVRLRGVPAPV